MPGTLQQFLAEATLEAAKNLETAFLRLPEDKRDWSPMGEARTALDMIAECAMLGDPTQIVQSRSFPSEFNFQDYIRNKQAFARQGWEAVRAKLHESASRAAETIRTVPDEDLGIEIQMPWGPLTLARVIAYPYWNFSYHEAQINYLASMLGCLE